MQLYHAEACSPCTPSLCWSAVLAVGIHTGPPWRMQHHATSPRTPGSHASAITCSSQDHRMSGEKPKESIPKRSDGSSVEMDAAVYGSEMVFWNCKLKYI